MLTIFADIAFSIGIINGASFNVMAADTVRADLDSTLRAVGMGVAGHARANKGDKDQ